MLRKTINLQRVDHSAFCHVVDALGRAKALALLQITERTLDRWLTNESRIPWAAWMTLWLHSPWGQPSQIIELENQHRAHVAWVAALESKIKTLEPEIVRQAQQIEYACANDPFFWPSDPRSAAIIHRRPQAAINNNNGYESSV